VKLYKTNVCGGNSNAGTEVQIDINKCYDAEATTLKSTFGAIEGFLKDEEDRNVLCETKVYLEADCGGNFVLTDNNQETCLKVFAKGDTLLKPTKLQAKSFKMECCMSEGDSEDCLPKILPPIVKPPTK
jgi:hypothetical protein